MFWLSSFSFVNSQGNIPSGTANGWNRCVDWSPGLQIALKTIPIVADIKACAGSKVNFSIVFSDLDQSTCTKGSWPKQFYDPNYRITFNTSSNDGSFSGASSITVGINDLVLKEIHNQPNDFYNINFSENATFKISDDWSGNAPIFIIVTVVDLGGLLTGCDTGDPTDSSVSFTWTIKPATRIPEALTRVSQTSVENTYGNAPLSIVYQGIPDAPPAYSGVAVVEQLSEPKPSGMFTINDLEMNWLEQEGIDTANEAARVIFKMSNPSTFSFDQMNQFTDEHDGFRTHVALQDLFDIFTDSAIRSQRLGYVTDQVFLVCGKEIGKARIFRLQEWDEGTKSVTLKIKKRHSF